MEIGKILRKARLEAKFTLSTVEQATGVISSRQSKIELGETTAPDFMAVARLAEFYSLSLDGLFEAAKTGLDTPATAAKAQKGHYVPIISWQQASQKEQLELIEPDLEVIASPFKCSDQAFGLRVKGDSMTGPQGSEYSFPEDSIVIVEPNAQARHKNFVIVQMEGANMATFKRLNLEDNGFLQPLNNQYPIVPIDRAYEVHGVVIGVIQKVKI